MKRKISPKTARLAWLCVLALPSLAAVSWSLAPAAGALFAVAQFRPITFADASFQDDSQVHDLRRLVQRQFLDHGLYIPLEDILRGNDAVQSSRDYSLLMQKACGRGKIHVWIPLVLRLPFIGDQVYEWCWKARIKNP